MVDEGTRSAEAGELCTCGRQAVRVFLGGRYGDTGSCGLSDGGLPVDGVCTFCGDTIDHAHYGRAERAAGRDSAAGGEDQPQGGRCPLYRLRLADPLPAVHEESVRRFDPLVWRGEQTRFRLRVGIGALLQALGIEVDSDEADIRAQITIEQLDAAAAAAPADPDAGARWLLDVLAGDIDEAGSTDHPVEDLTVARIAGETPGWADAEPLDRAWMVLARVRVEVRA